MEHTYLASTTTGHNASVLDRSFDYHNGIVKTPFDLCNELFGSSSKYQSASSSLGTALEEIEPLSSNLPLFKSFTGAKMLRSDVGAGRRYASPSCLYDAF